MFLRRGRAAHGLHHPVGLGLGRAREGPLSLIRTADEVAGVAFTRQGQRNAELMRVEQRRDGRGLPYFWLMFQRGEIRFDDDTDLAALAEQKISVTPLRLDLTDDETRLRLEKAFAIR